MPLLLIDQDCTILEVQRFEYVALGLLQDLTLGHFICATRASAHVHVLCHLASSLLIGRSGALGLLYFVQDLLEFDFHDADCVSALSNALLNLFSLALVVTGSCLSIQFSELEAELLFRLHHRLQLDKNRCGHVEEVVFSIKLLVILPELAALLAEFINGLLHAVPFPILETLSPSFSGTLLWIVYIIALHF